MGRKRGIWRRRRVALLLVGVSGVMAAGAAIALGSSPITASPASNAFTAPTFTIDQGEEAVFQNTGNTAHNVSDVFKASYPGYFFHSPPSVAAGASAPVNGTQYLATGSYPFECLIHGSPMKAELVVTGNGTPQRRPKLRMKVLSGKIEKVRSSGKLKVKVTTERPAEGIEVWAARSALSSTITKTAKIAALPAGGSKVVRLRLNRSGKKAMANDQAKVVALGFPEFGNNSHSPAKLID